MKIMSVDGHAESLDGDNVLFSAQFMLCCRAVIQYRLYSLY